VPAYWLMQTSLLVSAWFLWRAIFVSTAQPGPALAALVATTGQMGLLAALIVFAPRPLYAGILPARLLGEWIRSPTSSWAAS
jgi:Cytochrome c oxidase caa3 assembly factor (Caa3_CtaG).